MGKIYMAPKTRRKPNDRAKSFSRENAPRTSDVEDVTLTNRVLKGLQFLFIRVGEAIFFERVPGMYKKVLSVQKCAAESFSGETRIVERGHKRKWRDTRAGAEALKSPLHKKKTHRKTESSSNCFINYLGLFRKAALFRRGGGQGA